MVDVLSLHRVPKRPIRRCHCLAHNARMPQTEEISIPDWTTLAQLVEAFSDGSWIFRGVTNKEDHILVPKIGRELIRKNPADGSEERYSPDTEIKALRVFKRTARPYLRYQPNTELEWLAIGQHHGMPTRLLDWTESPLVAAFFATEKAGVDEGVPAVYCIKAPPDANGDEELDPFEKLSAVKTFRPPHISARIQVQRSVVTVHPRPWEAYEPPVLKKWVFTPGRESFVIKQVLDTCGINWASIFPDLQGLSEYITWRYRWGKLR